MNKRRLEHIVKTVDSNKPIRYGQLLSLINYVRECKVVDEQHKEKE